MFFYRCLSFCSFSFSHCLAVPLRYTESDCPFGVFKLFFQQKVGIKTVLLFLPTCSFIRMRETSYRWFRWSHISHWVWHKDTTDTDRSDPYIDLHLEIDSEVRLRMKLYDKRDDFNFLIVNFACICSNIPAAPAYGVYISQLTQYSRACGSYQDFIDRRMMLTRKLLNQGFLLVKLMSNYELFNWWRFL